MNLINSVKEIYESKLEYFMYDFIVIFIGMIVEL